jgi:1,4-alpha-glucan branching enzyme
MNKQKTKVQEAPVDQRIEREYSKDMKSCLIKFHVPKEIASGANSIAVAGTFNDWNQHSHQLEKQKNGDFRLDVVLEPDKYYEFRFIIDETRWENAHNADRYFWSDYSNCDNSVIET